MNQAKKLDSVLKQVVKALEEGRRNIYDIAEDCRQQCETLKASLEESINETARIVEQVDRCERLEKIARVRLMEVSRNFSAFSENDIKEAYHNAQTKQNELTELRQQESALRKKRDDYTLQLKKFEKITFKADSCLQNTALAIKVLETSSSKVSDTLEDAFKRQQLTVWKVESMEAQRRKIARELHDGPAQTMASMLLRLDLIEYLFTQDLDKTMEEIKNIREMGRESLSDIRHIMYDLKPSAINDLGMVATLQEYFDDYETKYDFTVDFVFFGKEKKHELALEIALFRMVQEAVANVRKHAGVKKALVKMEEVPSGLTLVIKDEGRGFSIEKVMNSGQESYGILGMKERAELFGGRVEIISALGVGTQVIVELPAEGEENNGEDKNIDS